MLLIQLHQKCGQEIEKLLNEYNFKTNITLEDIVDFHYRHEKTHPFGNDDKQLRQKKAYFQNSYISSGRF